MEQITELLVAFDDDDDKVYCQGMWYLLNDVFNQMGYKLKLIHDSESAIRVADIYITYFIAGMATLCQPYMKLRKKQSLSVVIIQGLNAPHAYGFPACLQRSVFLRKNDSTDSILYKIKYAWNNIHTRLSNVEDVCKYCQPSFLTESEMRVAHGLWSGLSVYQIADILCISPKTVSTHKRNIMDKFNLHSSLELMHFIRHGNKYLFKHTVFRKALLSHLEE